MSDRICLAAADSGVERSATHSRGEFIAAARFGLGAMEPSELPQMSFNLQHCLFHPRAERFWRRCYRAYGSRQRFPKSLMSCLS